MACSNEYIVLKVIPSKGIKCHKINNVDFKKNVKFLKNEAGHILKISSELIELIYHGTRLNDSWTLEESNIKKGETVHVIKKKVNKNIATAQMLCDSELREIVNGVKSLGNSPNSPGWINAIQILNEESYMNQILETVPLLKDDVISLSILQEMELITEICADIESLKKACVDRPLLSQALKYFVRLTRVVPLTQNEALPPTGFAYSLEALSEDEDGDDDDAAQPITEEQLAAALDAASGAIAEQLAASSNVNENAASPTQGTSTNNSHNIADNFSTQISNMHEMGLLDDAVNLRALLLSSGDINAAINLVLSGAIEE